MATAYLFLLGRTPELAFFELLRIVPSVTRLSPSVGFVDAAHMPATPQEVQDVVGGTVKIAEVVGKSPLITPEILAQYIEPAARTFGISVYDAPLSEREWLSDIKKIFEKQGRRIRFVMSKVGTLGSVVVAKEHLYELIVAKWGDEFVIGHTVAVQPFESWGKRDYGRPFADPKAGMLPPKVARMAVNIAVGWLARGKTIVDPFCGMGTVLAEALVRGCTSIGSDTSPEAVEKAKKNLIWLTSMYPHIEAEHVRLYVSDATHISENLTPLSIDAIVTEPFMGSTSIANLAMISNEKVQNTIKGLEKLYIGCLRDWHTVLKIHGRVVIALPEYVVSGKSYFVKKVIDSCENLGYTVEQGPFAYSRPQAVVRRKFYIFQKR